MKDSQVILKGVPVEVLRRVVYEDLKGIAVNTRKGEDGMDKKAKIDAILAANGSKWKEEDRTFLMTLNEEQLDKVVPEPKVDPPEDVAKKDEDAPEPDEKPAEEPVTLQAFIQKAPAEIQEVLNEAVTTLAQRKAALVGDIVGNKRNRFTKEALNAMSMNQLTGIAALAVEAPTKPSAPAASYLGLAPVANEETPHTEEALVAPVMNFKKDEVAA